jgi:hypothetical protein
VNLPILRLNPNKTAKNWEFERMQQRRYVASRIALRHFRTCPRTRLRSHRTRTISQAQFGIDTPNGQAEMWVTLALASSEALAVRLYAQLRSGFAGWDCLSANPQDIATP